MDARSAEDTRQSCRAIKEELDAKLGELEARRRELVARLEQACGGAAGGHAAAPGPSAAGEEGELEYCLQLLKLRCRALAEGAAEVALLAEALYSLARAGAVPRASGTAAPAAAPEAGPPGDGGGPGAPPPGGPGGSAGTGPLPGPGGGPEGLPAGLGALLASPGFQKVLASVLAQLVRK